MAPVANAFRARHRCISVDLLGHGQSPRVDDYSIAAQAAAVLRVCPEGAILVGHSMGGQVAVEAAVQDPGRVKGLVLLDPALMVASDRARAGAASMADAMRAGDFRAFVSNFASTIIRAPTDPQAYADVVARMKEMDPQVARDCWAALRSWDGPDRVAAVACPTLMIAIDKPVNKPADMARANPRIMTGQVAGAGHMMQFDAMDQVALMMQRWMALESLAPA